jgi:hypothetical protein
MSVLHTDDNLIEARLRQLEARTSITGHLSPPSADMFWPEMPVGVAAASAPAPGRNRWLGPILGIVVGSVVTQMITAMGSSDLHPPAVQVAVTAPAPAAPTATDPTTQALTRLIAAPPTTVSPSPTAQRAINVAEIVRMQQTRKASLGRQDPFVVVVRSTPVPVPVMAALPSVQLIVPEPPPQTPVAPKPATQVRFNGSFALNGAYTALIDETAHGTTVSRRWRQGDMVLGGYKVIEIGLRTLKLRLGGETILLSAGSSQDVDARAGGSGLSAIAPEPSEMPTGVRPAVWRQSPSAVPAAPLSAPMAPPLPPAASAVEPVASVTEVPAAEDPTAVSPAAGKMPDLPVQ